MFEKARLIDYLLVEGVSCYLLRVANVWISGPLKGTGSHGMCTNLPAIHSLLGTMRVLL